MYKGLQAVKKSLILYQAGWVTLYIILPLSCSKSLSIWVQVSGHNSKNTFMMWCNAVAQHYSYLCWTFTFTFVVTASDVWNIQNTLLQSCFCRLHYDLVTLTGWGCLGFSLYIKLALQGKKSKNKIIFLKGLIHQYKW